MLSVEGLGVAYGPVQALRDVSVTVGAHEFVSIIGPNGAGKTTLLKAICTAVPWSAGISGWMGGRCWAGRRGTWRGWGSRMCRRGAGCSVR